MHWLRYALAIALSLGAGCRARGGTDVGNGATASFDLGAYKPSATPISLDAQGPRVDTFLLAVEDFRLRRGSSCSGDESSPVVLDGPLVGDLLAPDPTQERDTIELASGAYCSLRASTAEIPAGLLPSSLASDGPVTVYVAGARADGVPFTVVLEQPLNLKLLSPSESPIELRDGSGFVLAFDLDAAIAALQLDALDGAPIRVDGKTNNAALSAFTNSLRKSASLFSDDNEDGVLDVPESSADKTLARGEL